MSEEDKAAPAPQAFIGGEHPRCSAASFPYLGTMTASQVIAQIDSLPPDEREAVFHHVHELEEAMIPESFLRGIEEAERGELSEMRDEHFQTPPVAP